MKSLFLRNFYIFLNQNAFINNLGVPGNIFYILIFVEIKIEKGFVLSKEDLVKTLIINERDFLNVKLIVYDNTQAIYQSEINNMHKRSTIVWENKMIV